MTPREGIEGRESLPDGFACVLEEDRQDGVWTGSGGGVLSSALLSHGSKCELPSVAGVSRDGGMSEVTPRCDLLCHCEVGDGIGRRERGFSGGDEGTAEVGQRGSMIRRQLNKQFSISVSLPYFRLTDHLGLTYSSSARCIIETEEQV